MSKVYRPCRTYAIVVDLDPKSAADLQAKLSSLQSLVEFIEIATPYVASIDDDYDECLGHGYPQYITTDPDVKYE